MRESVTQMGRSAAVLATFAVAAATLLAATWVGTRDRIAESERMRLLEQLNAVLPRAEYDNALSTDTARLSDPLLGPEPSTVYRARRSGEPVAAIFTVVAPDGYNGAIRLLVGVRADGRLSGVRALAHRETPGLGDKIEPERAEWVHAFDGRALGDPPPADWGVKKDGGVFDQFTGATITPRAVVKAVKKTLEYFAANRERVFETGMAGAP